MSLPLVSICSITYNHAPFIRQCLNSFLMQQTNFPIEIIINDDCSTDGTTEIIREYAAKYPDVIFPVYQEKNRNINAPFQKFVFPKARGKYIAICEGDDYWTDPLKLQKQVDFLESHPDYSMCFHKAKVIFEGVPEEYNPFKNIIEREYFVHETMRKWFIPTASMLMKREVALTAPTHRNFQSGDDVLQANSFVHGRVHGMAAEMSVYRRHTTSWASQNTLNISNYRIKSIPHYLALMESFPHKVIYEKRKQLACYCFEWIRMYPRSLQITPSIYILGSLKYCCAGVLMHLASCLVGKLLRCFGIRK